eukprot:Lankesteria_metandrocarpae@DN789_c0_g1_i1.p1
MLEKLSPRFKAFTRILGLLASVLTLGLGVYHILQSDVSLDVPTTNRTQDVNKTRWRLPLFTLAPPFFIDIWTPFLLGFTGCGMHFQSFYVQTIYASFSRFFLWHLFVGLFGMIGYSGILGIILSGFAWLTCGAAAICALFCEDHASLQLTRDNIPIVRWYNSRSATTGS